MKNKVIFRIKQVSWKIWVFVIVIAFGIFLCTFHFSEYLRFNSDQARDAGVVRLMAQEKIFPLLGPIAGGTSFHLGPAFYYFQYISTELFGIFPDKMAYPDLLWGILSILLIYFLINEYFGKKISLLLSGLYSICFFAIFYSRFAWNPNAASFFGMLFIFSMLKIAKTNDHKKIFWSILCGISLGILVQLHTILLISAVLSFILSSIIWLKRKFLNFRYWSVIILIALLLNVSQIISEVRTKGANFEAFKSGAETKNKNQSSLPKNIATAINCQFGSNLKIILPVGNMGEKADCQFMDSWEYKKLKKSSGVELFGKIALFVFSFIFSLGGYFFLAWNFKKETETKKKNFILMISIYIVSIMAIMFLAAQEMSLRYFIMLSFVPFIFLGFWIELILKAGKFSRLVILIISLILSVANVWAIKTAFADWSRGGGDMIDGSSVQVEKISDYIIAGSKNAKKIQIYGSKSNLARFSNRISYFTDEKGIEIVELNRSSQIDWLIPLFGIVNDSGEDYHIGDFYQFGYISEIKKIDGIIILTISEK